jgi:hypothetical protein
MNNWITLLTEAADFVIVLLVFFIAALAILGLAITYWNGGSK